MPPITLNVLSTTATDHSFHDGVPLEGPIETSQFEYLILLCERRFGKRETWDSIKETIFTMNDEYSQRCILKYCGYRDDVDTNLQRYQILVDFIRDDRFPIHQKIVAVDKLSECGESEIDTLKELYCVVNDETRQYLSFEIIYDEIRKKGFREVNRITRAVCDFATYESQDSVYSTVTGKLMSRFGKYNVLGVLGEIMKHRFATKTTKEIVGRVLEEANG